MTKLAGVNTTRTIDPPRLVIHGKGGSGKTTLGASVPACIFMPIEEGLGVLDVPHFDRPTTYAEVMNQLAQLYNDDHPYKSIIIDSVDKLEPLIWEHACTVNSTDKKTYEHIEDFGYGKGYTYSDPHWIEFFKRLDLLRRKKMTIVILSHNEVKTVVDPKIGPYDSVSPKLHKRANALMYEWADLVGYLAIERSQLDQEGARGQKMQTSQSLGTRILHLEDTGGFEAKNRYRLPKQIEIPEANGYATLRELILKSLGVNPKTKATNKKATTKKVAAPAAAQE